MSGSSPPYLTPRSCTKGNTRCCGCWRRWPASARWPRCPTSSIAMSAASMSIQRSTPRRPRRCCYWGRCTFCDHGQGYFDQYRGMPAHEVVRQIKALKEKYHAEHFLFADESYPPALFKKVVQLLVEQKVGIKWTTLIRFEETLQDPEIWKTAAQSGCCTLYYGMESANERVLNLMDKHVKQSVIVNNLREAAKVGIWNHVMAFYGFPGETREEAEETR